MLKLINDRYQVVNSHTKAFYKCHKDLLKILDCWETNSDDKNWLRSGIDDGIHRLTTFNNLIQEKL